MSQELTSSQLKHLRGLANRLDPAVIVGKSGCGQAQIEQVRRQLRQRELIKVRLLPAAGSDRSGLARELAEKSGAVLVGLAGRVVILYRPNSELASGLDPGNPGAAECR